MRVPILKRAYVCIYNGLDRSLPFQGSPANLSSLHVDEFKLSSTLMECSRRSAGKPSVLTSDASSTDIFRRAPRCFVPN